MNRFLCTGFAVGLLGVSLVGQSTAPQAPANQSQERQTPSSQPGTAGAQTTATAPETNSPKRISAGSVIPVQLTKSIDAKKAKKGDEVVAKVTQDMSNGAGTVLVPKDTKVVGHVTEAQARSKEQKESHLAVVFDQTVMKNGEQMQMPMSIQAIVAPVRQTAQGSGDYQPAAPGSIPTGGAPPTGSGRTGSMASEAPGQDMPSSTGSAPTDAPVASEMPHITVNTQGVVGIPDLQLSPATDGTQGSFVTSEKKNVKLEGGTLLLLRVNP